MLIIFARLGFETLTFRAVAIAQHGLLEQAGEVRGWRLPFGWWWIMTDTGILPPPPTSAEISIVVGGVLTCVLLKLGLAVVGQHNRSTAAALSGCQNMVGR